MAIKHQVLVHIKSNVVVFLFLSLYIFYIFFFTTRPPHSHPHPSLLASPTPNASTSNERRPYLLFDIVGSAAAIPRVTASRREFESGAPCQAGGGGARALL